DEALRARRPRVERVLVARGVVVREIEVAVLYEADRVHQVERLIAGRRAEVLQHLRDAAEIGGEESHREERAPTTGGRRRRELRSGAPPAVLLGHAEILDAPARRASGTIEERR